MIILQLGLNATSLMVGCWTYMIGLIAYVYTEDDVYTGWGLNAN